MVSVRPRRVARDEFLRLVRQIKKDRARLEHRDRRPAANRRVVDHGGNAVVRRDREELALELLALADIDRHDLVRQPDLFQKNRDLVPVRRGPVVQVDHDCLDAY
jgi:hypothetical protein